MPNLISALLQPACYAQEAAQVTLVETHISWVLLAGDRAYKIKKPVKLPFLDFSTLEQRRLACIEELRLNQRYAPDIYQDVVPISGTADRPQIAGLGTPIEYAVRMHRFDDAQRLDRVCARGQLTVQLISTLARAIVQLQACAAVSTDPDGFGSAASALRPALDNLSICEQINADDPTRARLATLRQWTEQQAGQLSPLFAQRLAQGWVRECHGDLHLGNMVLQDGAVRLFDCIEFNASLRWIDVASDLAFASMDLLHHGQGGLACWLLSEVLSATGDYGCAPVLRFYAVYRAMVRAKVSAIRLVQPEQAQAPADAAQGSRRELQAYLELAERLARPKTPCLTITHGVSGCGKSVAAQQRLLQDASGSTLRLRSDVERKRLFGLSALQRSGSALDNGLYSATAHAQTYARLAELADSLLQAGWSVVVDAAFLRRSERQAFADLALRHGVRFAIVAPQAQEAELRRRIVARAAAGTDPSEATLEVLDKQLAWVEPLGADELLNCESA